TGSATNQLVYQSIVRRITRNFFGEPHDIFPKDGCALLQIKRMPLSLSSRPYVLHYHRVHQWLLLPTPHCTRRWFLALEFDDCSFSGGWILEFGAFHLSTW